MTRRTRNAPLALLLAVATATVFSGCGATPVSRQLLGARRQVELARNGIAAQLEPDELRVAERRLALAEGASDGSREEIHLAYLADRQARLATANAEAQRLQASMERERDSYQDQLEATAASQQQALERGEARLAGYRAELDDVRVQLQLQGNALDERTEALRAQEAELNRRIAELGQERSAREAAEQRAAAALTELRRLTEFREEQDRWVITISGEVLFESGRSTLLESATRRLTVVAEALLAEPDAEIVIEGHTDSRGSIAYNARLSHDRANAVRTFLIGHGVAAERLRAVGLGEQRPVANNATAEGRANNRRVEIIVDRT